MQLELDGKVALVTGSSSGIGNAIAQSLSEEGCKVVLNGRNEDNLNIAISEIPGSIGISGDVSNPIQAEKIIEKISKTFGSLDILVCNVGSGRSVSPGSEFYDEWQRVFAVNLWSTTNIIEAAKKLLTGSEGTIICISSICGHEVIPGAPVTYSAAKAALHAYVRGISRPLGKSGVRINAIAPGNILFEGSVWSKKLKEDENSVKKMLDSDVPLTKLGTPQDVADLVVFLASPRSNFVTGSIWTLDGGQVHN